MRFGLPYAGFEEGSWQYYSGMRSQDKSIAYLKGGPLGQESAHKALSRPVGVRVRMVRALERNFECI